jgi:hypothetical protein
LIQCDSCGIQYVGQTKRSLRHRVNNHRYDILNERPSVISHHFNQIRCEIQDFKIIPIHQCRRLSTDEETTKERLDIEQYFIRILKTYRPHGLNIAQRKFDDSPAIHLILTYSGISKKASKIVEKHYKSLQDNMPDIFSDVLVTAYQRNKNIGDNLVSSKLK